MNTEILGIYLARLAILVVVSAQEEAQLNVLLVPLIKNSMLPIDVLIFVPPMSIEPLISLVSLVILLAQNVREEVILNVLLVLLIKF